MKPLSLLLLLLPALSQGAPATSPPQRDQEALAAAVQAYFAASNPAAMHAAVAAAEDAAPSSATAHELAANLAELEAKPREQIMHLLAALRDPQAEDPLDLLHELADLSWTAQERHELEALLRELRQKHPRAEARAFAAWMAAHAAHLRGDESGRDIALAEVGFRPPLAVIGTWSNDQGKGFDLSYPPEKDLNLSKQYQGHLMKVGWRTGYRMDPRGKLNFEALMAPDTWLVAYAATGLKVAEAGTYELRIGSSDPLKVWVNDELVFAGRRLGGWVFDGVIIPVHLRAGVNRVLLKSAQERGSWLMVLRVTGPGGEFLGPTAVEALPADQTPSEGAPPAKGVLDEKGLIKQRLEKISPEHHQRLRLSWGARLGLKAPVAGWAEEWVSAQPKSLSARYHLAVALWNNQERGRTADLLQTLHKEAPSLLRFSLKQARFWSQQKLEIKARRLLQELTRTQPDRALPILALARLFRQEGWHEEESTLLRDLNRRWPAWPLIEEEWAESLQSLKLYPQAEQLHRAMLQRLPYALGLLRELHRQIQENDHYEEAVQLARKMTQAWPQLREPWRRLAESLRRAGRFEEAAAAIQEIRRIAPQAPEAYQLLATLALERGAQKQAVAYFKEALLRDPENEKIANRLAFLAPKEEGPWSQDIPDEVEILALVQKAPSIKTVEGANVIFLMDDEVTSLAADGSTINVVTQAIYILNQAGRDRYTRMSLRGGGRSRILAAYSIDPKGQRNEASSIRGRTLRFRQLEVGSTVVLQYRIDQRPDSYLAHHMSRQWWFQMPLTQIYRGRWVLWAPAKTQLSEHRQGKIERYETPEGDLIRIVWSSSDAQPIIREPGMPQLSETAAHVYVSTISDWETVWAWERALLKDAFRESPEVKALADELALDTKNPQEKIEKIHNYLMKRIRYQQDYEHPIAGVKPHPAAVVLARQYGDCKDKAVLFITLARLMGLKARFALVRTRDSGPLRLEVPGQVFNHAIVYIPAQEGIPQARFYDATVDALDVGVLRHDDPGTLSAVYDPETKEHSWIKIPFDPPENDYARLSMDLKLDLKGGAKGEVQMQARGRGGALIRKGSRNLSQLKQLLEQEISRNLPGSQLNEVTPLSVEDLFEPAKVKIEVETETLGHREGQSLRFKLPFAWRPETWFGLAERLHPILLGSPRVLRYALRLKLPEGGEVKRLPHSDELRSECLSLKRTVEQREGEIFAQQEVRVQCERIEVKAYRAHRESAQRMRQLLDEEIILEFQP